MTIPSLPRHGLFFLVLITSLLGSCARHRTTTATVPPEPVKESPGYRELPAVAGDPMDVRRFELDNGLLVYLTRHEEQPRFYTEVAVRAGSKHDPHDATGLAHYLEHLLFKGTSRLGTLNYEAEKPHLDRITELYEEHFQTTDPERRREIYAEINREAQEAAKYAVPNEFDSLFNGLGSQQSNAHTWLEETVYKVDLPANRLEQWAIVEAERYADPVFRLFHTELEIVYEEKNRSLDDKNRLILDAVMSRLYSEHPYGTQTTLGEAEHLKNPSLVKIEDYFEKYYVPNNMAVFISGDIDPDETIKIIAREFKRLENKPLPPAQEWNTDTVRGRELVEVLYPGEEYVMMAFPTVSQNHPDAEALMILDSILSNRTAGLIDLNLNQQQRVRSAGSYPFMYNDAGAQILYGVPKAEQSLEDVEKLLLEQVELIKRGEFDTWLIPAIINDFRKMYKSQMESNTGRVARMRSSFIQLRDWEDELKELSRLEAVTREDVLRVANQYFGENYVVGFRRDGKATIPVIEKPQIDPIVIDTSRQSEFARNVLAMQVPPIEPEFIEPERDYFTTYEPAGRKIYYSSNPVNDLFTLRFVVDLGRENSNTLSIGALLLEKSGTERFSADDLRREWYRLGTDFNIAVNQFDTAVTISGLDENFEESLKLMLEMLQTPRADDETLEELKKIVLAQREDSKKDPATIASALVQYNRFGPKSSFLQLLPSDGVRALTRDQLFQEISGLLDYKHSFEYTGSLKLEDVQAKLNAVYPVTRELQDPPQMEFKRLRAIDETEILFFHKETAQSQIRLEFGSTDFEESRVPAIELYNHYFGGGMSSVVFQELREARALAYAAWGGYVQPDRLGRQNVMIGVIGSQVDKTIEATEAFITLMDNLPESEERFLRTMEALENDYRTGKIGFRGIIGEVRQWERLGLPSDPRSARFDAVRTAGVDTLREFYTNEIAGRPKLISILGDKNRVDMEALAKIGRVLEVEEADVFVD